MELERLTNEQLRALKRRVKQELERRGPRYCGVRSLFWNRYQQQWERRQ